MAKKIDFITEKKDYNAAEFYKKHKQHLPKLMMVTQGFYGNGIEETFDKGEVLLLVIVSEQRRVVTRVRSGAGRCRLLSIPSSYHETFCIVSDDRRNVRESYLCDILREHRLPFTVQFPMDRVITVGHKSLNTNRIPKMELLETFEEKHLLGNRIVDGEMTEDILHIPLHLSQLRMSIISGIKGQSKHIWKLFLQDLVHKSDDVEYDFEFGNPDIAEYKVDGDHSVKEYPFEEPQIYENIINIIQRWPECHPRNESGILRGNGVNTHKEYVEGILKTQEYETVEYKPLEKACGKQHSRKVYKHKAPVPIPVVHRKPELDKITKVGISEPVTNKCIGKVDAKCVDNKQKPIHYRRGPCSVDSSTKLKAISNDARTKEDFLLFTVNDVLDYLRTLGMEQYVDIFHKNLVDGQLLINMDKTMLMEDLGMKETDVKKLLLITENTETIQSTVQSGDFYTDLITNEEMNRKEEFPFKIDTHCNVYESIGNAVVYEEIGSFESTEDTTQYRDIAAFGNSKEIKENENDQHPLDSENPEHILKLNVRPVHSKDYLSTIKNASHVSCKEVEIDTKNSTDSYVTLIPGRTTSSVTETPEEHKYVNNIPSKMVAPVLNLSQIMKSSVDQTLKTSRSLSRNESCTDQNIPHGQVTLAKDAFAELTIQEVCEYLGKLHLEQYEESFTEQMIDGAILAELDKDILVQEFGMKKVEALRLMKFAKHGRLPKST